MRWNIKADRPTIVVGCSLGMLLVLVLYWVLHFWFLRQGFVEEIDAIQPRIARLMGIMQSAEQLHQASGDAGGMLHELAYPDDRDSATTAAAMQRDIRELMTSAGLSISGSQILPLRRGDGFDLLSLEVTAAGNVDALEEAFVNMEEMRPLVFVKLVKVKPTRNRSRRASKRDEETPEAGDPRKLSAQFQLISLRLQG